MSNSGDAGAIADMIGQCQDGYEVQLRELDRQIEDEKRRIQKVRPCPFIQILSRFYPDTFKN